MLVAGEPARLLIVAPHPDDESIGAGGLFSRVKRSGGEVLVVLGSARGAERHSEMQSALARLGGAALHTISDAPLLATDERQIVGALEEAIQDFQPSIFVLPEDAVHPEHRLLHRASIAATRPSGGSGRLRPPHVWCWEAPSDSWGQVVYPDIYVRLEEVDLDTKVAALKCHLSQWREGNSERGADALQSLARLRGLQAGVPFAEAFRSLRNLY